MEVSSTRETRNREHYYYPDATFSFAPSGTLLSFSLQSPIDVVAIQEVIQVLAGGETSFKCCRAIESSNLQVIDEAEFAIPLCLDYYARWIVTKSGNMGSVSALIDIINYFKRHEQ